jgi:RHS repeat-associated protein
MCCIKDDQVYFYHTDHLGTPMEMTDEEGRIVWWGTYKAFGSCWVEKSCAIENNLRLPGQYYDAESGLHYNCFRYYDPIVGRYISQDPIGYNGDDFNLYRYVQSDPVNLIDPWGMIWVTVGYDYHGIKNVGRFFVNRIWHQIGSGFGPSFPGADPKEYLGLKRDVIQEWVPDYDSNNEHIDCAYEIGTQRRITKTWSEKRKPGPGETFITSTDTHYSYPQVNHYTYDYYGESEKTCK